jgi:hypothetical protein
MRGHGITMTLALLLIIVAIVGVTWWLNTYVVPPGARTALKFSSGKITVVRGTVSSQTQRYVQDVLRDGALAQGCIGILPNGRIWFSPSIPESVHQQLRNILMR